MSILVLSLAVLLAEHFVLVQVLGLRPFLGVPSKTGLMAAMGLTVTVIMGITAGLVWLADTFWLAPLSLTYLRSAVYLLAVAGLVWAAEQLLKTRLPALHAKFGIYLPLITANCAVLGVALLNRDENGGLGAAALGGVLAGLGFTLAMGLFSTVWERLSFSKCPKSFEGFPLALVAAGLIAMVLMGFFGMH